MSSTGLAWFAGAGLGLAVFTYGVAETLADRIGSAEEYANAIPTIGIAPWFFAGSLFPISSLPGWVGAMAKFLPVTHAVALMRYGVVDRRASDLHAIWGMGDPTAMAALSLAVLGAYAIDFTFVPVRAFSKAAVR